MPHRDLPHRDLPPRDLPPRDLPPRDLPPRDLSRSDLPPRDLSLSDLPPRDLSLRESPWGSTYDDTGWTSRHGQTAYGLPGPDGAGDDGGDPGRELEPLRRSRLAQQRALAGDDEDDRVAAARNRRMMPLWQELPLLLVVAFCLAVLIRTFLLQAFYIPSTSMEETLLVGDRVLVNKIVYDVRPPERGEVVVFRGTDNWAPEAQADPAGSLFGRVGRTLGDLVGISRPGEKDFIKRVIGLPGDRVSCCDPQGRVYVNGKGIDEPYIYNNNSEDVPPNPRVCGSRRFEEVLVPPGQIFVMGDHRLVSQDSRCAGPVPIENVIGRAFVIVWPSGRWDGLSVPETFANVPGPVALGPGQPAAPSALAASAAGAAVALPLLAAVAMAAGDRRRSWVVTGRTAASPRRRQRTLRR
jgi:signal peptidase I